MARSHASYVRAGKKGAAARWGKKKSRKKKSKRKAASVGEAFLRLNNLCKQIDACDCHKEKHHKHKYSRRTYGPLRRRGRPPKKP